MSSHGPWREQMGTLLADRLTEQLRMGARARLPRRVAEVAGLMLITIVVAVVDYRSGPYWGFSAFYVSIAVVAAALLGTHVAAPLAVAVALAWTASDAIEFGDESGFVPLIWNLIFRIVTLGTGVFLVAALRNALRRALDSERTTRAFLAGAAHQLRTPLSGIQSSVEALTMAESPDDADELLAQVGNEAARAGRMVSSLLRMARLDQGEPLLLRPSRLADIVAEEVDRQRGRCRPEVDLCFVIDDKSLDDVMALDTTVLREAVGNLLDNARRHAETKIEVRVCLRLDQAEVSVWDDGAGVSASEQETVFAPFVSLDGKGGTGVGLTVARGIAQAHGGTLRYEVGRGFRMVLPTDVTRGGPGRRNARGDNRLSA